MKKLSASVLIILLFINLSLANNSNIIDLSKLTVEEARRIAPIILDAMDVPDGDIAILGQRPHSKRYIISKWQRAAVGSHITIIGKDKNNNLSVVLGKQKNYLRSPQGYMEIPLPKEDLTGLRNANASRMNGKTMEKVPQDQSIEDNAVREIYEEAGLKIKKEELILIGVSSNIKSNPISFAAKYLVVLDDLPILKSNETEFAFDDLTNPMWVALSSLKYNPIDQIYYTNLHELPVGEQDIENINLSLKKLDLKEIAK